MYLNVDQVEAALVVATSAPFDAFTQLSPLPHRTWAGRQCHAVKIANGSNPGRTGVYFVGGLHGREWGSCDILINFIEELQQAFLDSTDVTLGNKTFSAAQIQTIVNTLDIIVFPQANPDGRNRSMIENQVDPIVDWRKNLRTEPPNSSVGDCVGVDINRNFDFLWDFETHFSSLAPIRNSTNPCNHDVYVGDEPFSEPETKNIRALFDEFPNISFFVDLHCYSQRILYNWGDDENQTEEPGMNFQNQDFDGMRGVSSDGYKEYIRAGDQALAIELANDMRDAIQAVRTRAYTVQSSYALYPTAGTSTDYAYSRHIVDPGKQKVISHTIEWGGSNNLPTPFHPHFAEMQEIINEVTAGLLEYCLSVRKKMTACVITTDRSTFGRDEIEAMLHVSAPAILSAAFYVVIDGFPAEELGITDATLSGTPDVRPSISFSPTISGVSVRATACEVEGDVLKPGPQRFTWAFDLIFANSSEFNQEVKRFTMTASMNSTPGISVSGQAVITLILQPNPFEVDGAVSWLSTDLRVFRLKSNNSLPATPSVVLGTDPNDFISQLIARYNDPTLSRAPDHPFDTDLSAERDESELQIATTEGFFFPRPVYNFAVARVRYRALTTAASNVRVFFRLFQTSTTSTHFQPSTTYATGGQGGDKIPLLGVVNGEIVTIPCFAARRVHPANPLGLHAQKDPVNVGPLGEPIPPDGSGAEVQVYFGCWLDINQTNPVLPINPDSAAGPFTGDLESVQQAIVRSPHQCLVAEINIDPPVPQIPTGTPPALSDKLAQRNVAIIGVASPHLVPQTFDIKPTSVSLQPNQSPDELMIDWGNVPVGTEANIYLPGTSADTILGMANRLYTQHGLSRVDAHTLRCKAHGITYMPIPPGIGSNYAGLLSIQLPEVLGERRASSVIIRQITNTSSQRPAGPIFLASATTGATQDIIEWRRVVGAFQVNIPVKTKEALLESEEQRLSVLRWVAESIPFDSRWYPVFVRYLDQIADRVDSLGGDPDQIVGAPDGNGRTACGHKIKLLFPIILALLLVLIALSPLMWGAPLAAAGMLLIIAGASYWYCRCKPSLCGLLCALILGISLAYLILGIIVLLGYGGLGALLMLAVLGVLNGLLLLMAMCQGRCWKCT